MEFLDTMEFMLEQIYQISYYAKPFTIAFFIILLLIFFSVVGVKSRIRHLDQKVDYLIEKVNYITEWIDGEQEEGEQQNE